MVLTTELFESQLLQRSSHLLTIGRCVVLNFYVPVGEAEESHFPLPTTFMPTPMRTSRTKRSLGFDGRTSPLSISVMSHVSEGNGGEMFDTEFVPSTSPFSQYVNGCCNLYYESPRELIMGGEGGKRERLFV